MRTTLVLLAAAMVGSVSHASSSGQVTFPKNFRWCVATAAHQIEGNNTESDWWDWEQLPGRIKRGERSGPACDHWNRVELDTQLMRTLGVNTYRFSIEWAKIEPREGQYDRAAVDHYRRELTILRLAGIEPMITLHHFTFPRWVREKGGWEWTGIAEAFTRFAVFALENIAPETRDWVTINEPLVNVTLGYMAGLQPPGRQGGIDDLHLPIVGCLKAHAAAYRAMKASFVRRTGKSASGLRIGIAHHVRVFDPASDWNPVDAYLASRFDQAFNWAFGEALETGRLRYSLPLASEVDDQIEGLAGTQDFIGLNYYTRDLVSVTLQSPGFKFSVPKGAPLSDVGWELYPEGFYRVLKAAAQRFPGKSIMITENGVADARDSMRAHFLETHLEAMARAMSEGVPIEGYCHWSLLDNFEWSEGFAPRFGLFETDYKTFERRPRASAFRFAEIIRRSGF